MNINTQNPYAATAARNASAQTTSNTPSVGGFNILSGIESTQPGGTDIGIFRIDGGTTLAGYKLSDATAPAVPTKQDKLLDQSMLSAFMQMDAQFGQTATSENTELFGTAAEDLKLPS